MTLRCLAVALSVLSLAGFPAQAEPAEQKPELIVAISVAIPPYVLENASGGLEVDILRQALPGYALRFMTMPYAQLQTAIERHKADISAGMHETEDAVFFSRDFVAFENYAISKKADHFQIDRVADLEGHGVLTWQGAHLKLGKEFAALFGPGAPGRANNVEVANQEDQVRMFWEGDGPVVVIDRGIFTYFSRKTGHAMSDVELHALFPSDTHFEAGFKNASVRDDFNRGLDELCRGGEYAKLLDRHEVVFSVEKVCP